MTTTSSLDARFESEYLEIFDTVGGMSTYALFTMLFLLAASLEVIDVKTLGGIAKVASLRLLALNLLLMPSTGESRL